MTRAISRWHRWLGWVAAIPLLFWTVSGLVMVSRPIEEVRGEALRRPVPMLAAGRVQVPQLPVGAVKSLALEQQFDGARWIVTFADGRIDRRDAGSGAVLPPLTQAQAETAARFYFAGPTKIVAARAFAADAVPIDLRRPRPAWQVRFADGTNVYVDRDTGGLLAIRTRLWRVYDWMWGLHIMDLRGREDTHHPILILSAIAALGTVILGIALLPTRGRRP